MSRACSVAEACFMMDVLLLMLSSITALADALATTDLNTIAATYERRVQLKRDAWWILLLPC